MAIEFKELIKPGSNFEFIGKSKLWFTISIFAVLGSIAMLPINHAVRGSVLNWTIDFKGGTEIVLTAEEKVGTKDVRGALEAAGHNGVDVSSFAIKDKDGKALNGFLVRLAEFGAVKKSDADKISADLVAKFADREVSKATWSGDVLYVRSTQPITDAEFAAFLAGGQPKLDLKEVQQKEAREGAVPSATAGQEGREYNYQVAVYGLDKNVAKALSSKLGSEVSIKQVDAVGAKAGKELRNDGIKSLLYAIALIMLYIAFRFDFRYGPGTVAALLHDAILTVGVFAVLWTEFSLTTVAAVLTVIGYSMNDTVVVFDRIRENETKLKDKKFDRVINISINETLSRTILTSLTTMMVTLAMNVLGTGLVKNFAFAMNIGIVVGTYSSIFIAAPLLLWLNEKYFARRPASATRRGRMTESPVESA